MAEGQKRARLERYLARGVVDRILALGESSPGLSMRSEEADATVLFCDMAGFTARSEELAPHEVLQLLNRCFSHMTELVTVLGNTVNLASRIQSAVARPGQIVLSGDTRERQGDEFDLRPVAVERALKGIKREVRAFELLGARRA